MVRFRWFAALLAGLFALHLTVVGGLAFAMPSAGEMQTMAMQESGAPMPDMAESSEASVPSSGEMPCSDEAPCQMPGMPSGCPSTLPCPSAISLPAGQTSFALVSIQMLRPAAVAVRAPHTRLSPPELPPPRA
jgi:hypothetical protein